MSQTAADTLAKRSANESVISRGQGALTQHKMGPSQHLPHVDMMAPITLLSSTVSSTERVAGMDLMAARESFISDYGRSCLETLRGVLDAELVVGPVVVPKPGKYRASTKKIGDQTSNYVAVRAANERAKEIGNVHKII